MTAVAPLFLLLAVSLFAGCSLHSGTLPPGPNSTAFVENVPFHAQEEYLCGPAALAMALSWSGRDVAPDALVDSVYTPGKKGSFQNEMVTAARRQGRIAYPIRGPEALVAELTQGNPVIVLQNLGLSWFPQWHYAVVIGYDRPNNEVLLHSGLQKQLRKPFPVFENTWGRSDFWGLLVLPPDRLPATAELRPWLEAAVGLERARKFPEALLAYETAVARWPESHDAWMGLGNTRYVLHDKRGSEEAFQHAVEAHPESGIAFNNLAHVLSELGRYREAVAAARKAVAIGGPQADVFRRTLSDIEQTHSRTLP